MSVCWFSDSAFLFVISGFFRGLKPRNDKDVKITEISLLELQQNGAVGAAALGAKHSGYRLPVDYKANSKTFCHQKFDWFLSEKKFKQMLNQSFSLIFSRFLKCYTNYILKKSCKLKFPAGCLSNTRYLGSLFHFLISYTYRNFVYIH